MSTNGAQHNSPKDQSTHGTAYYASTPKKMKDCKICLTDTTTGDYCNTCRNTLLGPDQGKWQQNNKEKTKPSRFSFAPGR